MQTITYPGFWNTNQAEYGVARYRKDGSERADIVAINSIQTGPAGTSLWNTADGRDYVLNTVLAQELAGFRIDRVRFFVFVDCPHTQTMHALELLIEPVTWSSRFMQRGGWGRYRSQFDYRRHLPADEIRRVCATVGYQRDTRIPAWLDGIFLGGPLSALTSQEAEDTAY